MKYANIVNGVVDSISHEIEAGAGWVQVDDSVFAGFAYDGSTFTAPTITVVVVPNLPKLLVIDRLQTAGKFTAALTTLQANMLAYERWSASTSVDPSNPEVIGLLNAIGADKSVILAPG